MDVCRVFPRDYIASLESRYYTTVYEIENDNF